MNDIDIETRLREQLPRLADLGVDELEPTLPLARVQPLAPARPRRWKIAAAAGVAAALVAGAVVVVGALQSGDDRRAPTGVSSEPVVETLRIRALNFHFDAPEYHVPAGRIAIDFISDEGSHTLRFADPSFSDVRLLAYGGTPPEVFEQGQPVAPPAERTSATVDLEAGRTYVIYCALPGHRQAGMESRIVVEGTPTTTTIAP